MSGWGLLGAATAQAPQETLEEIIAAQAMKDDARRKQAIEQRKLGQDDARIGVDQGGLKLRQDEFTAARTDKDNQRQQLQTMIDAASKDPKTQYLVPVFQAKMAGLETSPVNADTFAMSPAERHTQLIADETAKAAAVAASQEKARQEEFAHQDALHAAPTFRDAHPKPEPRVFDPFTMTWSGGTTGSAGSAGAATAPQAGGNVLRGFKPSVAPSGGVSAATGAQQPNVRDLIAVSHAPTGAPSPNPQSAGGQPQSPTVGREGGDIDQAKLDAVTKQNPRLGQMTKMFINGTFPVPTGNALKDPTIGTAMLLAGQIDPSFEGANYATRAKTQERFTSGDEGKTVANINSVIGHIAGLDDSVNNGLRNWDLGAASWPVNWIKNNLFRGGAANDGGLNAFDENANLASGELSKVYTGSAGGEGDRANARAPFGENNAPSSNKAAIKKALDLLKSKMDSMENQYQSGMGSRRFSVKGLLSPEARSAFDSLMEKYSDAPAQVLAAGPGEHTFANGQTWQVSTDGKSAKRIK